MEMKTWKLDPRLRRLSGLDAGKGAWILAELRIKDAALLKKFGFPHVPVYGNVFAVKLPSFAKLKEFEAQHEVVQCEASRRVFPVLDQQILQATRVNEVLNLPPPAGADGSGVVIGIVDFWLDYTLADFRDAAGKTRIAFLWDQTLEPRQGEAAPQVFEYGVEYKRQDLDRALAQADPLAVVRHRPPNSESEIARHGTQVSAVAAGVAPGASLIFVNLDRDKALQTTISDSVNLVHAIKYCFDKAKELNRPCVVNLSVGFNGGGHDGGSRVEQSIDEFLGEPGRAVTVAAGNEHTWPIYRSGRVAVGETRVLRWQMGDQDLVLGGGFDPDREPNEMEIWYSPGDKFKVRLKHANGKSTSWAEPGEDLTHTFPSGERSEIRFEGPSTTGASHVYISVQPNAQGEIGGGIWQVELEAKAVSAGSNGGFDAWIERDPERGPDDFNERFQSLFLRADCDPATAKSITTPATARRAIAVGNYDHEQRRIAESSGHGRTRDGREKPDVAAPGTHVFPNASGTSLSAPHVAGITALLLSKRPDLTADRIRQILIGCTKKRNGVRAYDTGWGYGLIDARAALDELEALPASP